MPGGLHAPISVLLTWRPNYVNPEIRDMKFLCFVAALLSFTYFVVALRLWARFKLANNAGVDDLLIMFNLVRFYWIPATFAILMASSFR